MNQLFAVPHAHIFCREFLRDLGEFPQLFAAFGAPRVVCPVPDERNREPILNRPGFDGDSGYRDSTSSLALVLSS